MKKTAYIVLTSVLLLCSATLLSAQQNLRSAYFLDGYTYGYKMNAAFAPERGFFAIPVAGNLGIGAESSLALSDLLYPTANGGLTTFMNSSVPADDFLSRIDEINKLNLNVNASIVALGFRTGKAFHTFDVSLRTDVGMQLPYSLFSFLKEGNAGGQSQWNLAGVGAKAEARLEIAYGYSRSISDWMRVGARVKLIKGITRADINIDNLDLQMNDQAWSASSHGSAKINAPLTVGLQEGSRRIDFDNISLPSSADGFVNYLNEHSNTGFAVDLGASFDFLDYFTASVAVNDLGVINWSKTMNAEMPQGEWTFDGLGTIQTGKDNDSSLSDQLSGLGDELMNLVAFEMIDEGIKESSMLSATVHAGFEARMPFYERMSFGLLGTQRIDGDYSWTEGRLSMNLAPTNWFSLAATYAISDFGQSAGGVINFHLPGINLYVGTDSFLPMTNVTPQFIPIDSWNTNISLGLNLAIGKAVGRFRTTTDK